MSNKRFNETERDDIRLRLQQLLNRLVHTKALPEVPGVTLNEIVRSFFDPEVLAASDIIQANAEYAHLLPTTNTAGFNLTITDPIRSPGRLGDYVDRMDNLDCTVLLKMPDDAVKFNCPGMGWAKPRLRKSSPHYEVIAGWAREAHAVHRRIRALTTMSAVILKGCNTPGQLKRALPDIAYVLPTGMDAHVEASTKASPLPEVLKRDEHYYAELNHALVGCLLLPEYTPRSRSWIA